MKHFVDLLLVLLFLQSSIMVEAKNPSRIPPPPEASEYVLGTPEEVSPRLIGKYRIAKNDSPDSLQELVLRSDKRFEWVIIAGTLDANVTGNWSFADGVLTLTADPVKKESFFQIIDNLSVERNGVNDNVVVSAVRARELEAKDYICSDMSSWFTFIKKKYNGEYRCQYSKGAPDLPFEIQLFTTDKSLKWSDVSVTMRYDGDKKITKQVDSNGYVIFNAEGDFQNAESYVINYKFNGIDEHNYFPMMGNSIDGNYSKVFYLFDSRNPNPIKFNEVKFNVSFSKNKAQLLWSSMDLPYTRFEQVEIFSK